MRILLLGDYSNVHATLAIGLRHLGHEVCVASDGDGWKNYPRDIDFKRPQNSKIALVLWFFKLLWNFYFFKNYDVVQLINPIFLPLKVQRLPFFYRLLRVRNRSIFLAAFGMDYYWIKAGTDCHTFRYSDFNIGQKFRQREDNQTWITEWLYGKKGELNQYIAQQCDGIIAGLYEYYLSYTKEKLIQDKVHFIPFPIIYERTTIQSSLPVQMSTSPLHFFIGIQRSRHSYKGTDIMLQALQRLAIKYPHVVCIHKAENIPFKEYKQLMQNSHILLDQLYSYTPAMNALQAMAQGLIIVGGGEEENYQILNCQDLRPIINVLPSLQDVYQKLEWLVINRTEISRLSLESREYIKRYHNHIHVAQQYIDYWTTKLTTESIKN